MVSWWMCNSGGEPPRYCPYFVIWQTFDYSVHAYLYESLFSPNIPFCVWMFFLFPSLPLYVWLRLTCMSWHDFDNYSMPIITHGGRFCFYSWYLTKGRGPLGTLFFPTLVYLTKGEVHLEAYYFSTLAYLPKGEVHLEPYCFSTLAYNPRERFTWNPTIPRP